MRCLHFEHAIVSNADLFGASAYSGHSLVPTQHRNQPSATRRPDEILR